MTRRSFRRTTVAAALTGAILLACAGPALAADAYVTFTGRGWGHGIGMSQHGARGYALHGYGYRAILAHYYTGTAVGTQATRTVRVALDDGASPRSSWILRANSGELWIDYGATKYDRYRKGSPFTFVSSGLTISAIDPSTKKAVKTYRSPIRVWERLPSGRAGVVEVVSASGPRNWANVAYLGSVRFVATNTGQLNAYNWVGMEDYVRCVGPRETPASWPVESLKAQIVAARSYAHRSMKPTRAFDVYCTTRSQVYNGFGRVSGGKVTRHGSDQLYDAPVKATANQVVKYRGAVADTYFFNVSGGHTKNIENVWTGSSPVPYLKGVSDPYEGEARVAAPRYIWDERWTYSIGTLRSKLVAAGFKGVPATLTNVRVTRRGTSPRVRQLVLDGTGGSTLVVEGSSAIASFKKIFGWGDTWFYAAKAQWNAVSVPVKRGGSAYAALTLYPAPPNGWVYGLVVEDTAGHRLGKGRLAFNHGSARLTVNNVTKNLVYRFDTGTLGSTEARKARGSGRYYVSPKMTFYLR